MSELSDNVLQCMISDADLRQYAGGCHWLPPASNLQTGSSAGPLATSSQTMHMQLPTRPRYPRKRDTVPPLNILPDTKFQQMNCFHIKTESK
jgi:hypothetical protein